jgi:hypothetical protein
MAVSRRLWRDALTAPRRRCGDRTARRYVNWAAARNPSIIDDRRSRATCIKNAHMVMKSSAKSLDRGDQAD